MTDMIEARGLEIITSEIKVIEQQTAKAVIYGCIEIGKRLVEAKEIVGHGGWGRYLEEHVQYSQQWATNLMNLYREYGQSQESLFEDFAKSQSFGNLEVTKHILLLGIPAQDRAAFAEATDAEHSSVRELKEAIKARDAAMKTAQEQTERAGALEKQVGDTVRELEESREALNRSGEQVQKLREEAEKSQKMEEQAARRVAELEKQLSESKKAVEEAQNALQAVQENPQVPDSMMEALRKEAEADALKQAAEKMEKQLDAAREAAARAEKDGEELRSKLELAEKRIQKGGAELERVKIYLGGVQEQFQNLIDALKAVKLTDPEIGGRMLENVRGKLIENMKKALEQV